MALLVNQPR